MAMEKTSAAVVRAPGGEHGAGTHDATGNCGLTNSAPPRVAYVSWLSFVAHENCKLNPGTAKSAGHHAACALRCAFNSALAFFLASMCSRM